MKLSDLVPEIPVVETSIGTIYVHNLTVGVAKKLSKMIDEPDLEVVGSKTLQLLLSKDNDKSSRIRLSDDEYAGLSSEDFKKILPVSYKQCGFGDPDEAVSMSDFGASVQGLLKELSENSERISKNFKSILSPSTLSSYSAGLDGISNVTEKILQSIAPVNLRVNAGESLFRVTDLNSPPRIDFSAMPENRAAKATEKSAETLEHMSDLLLEMAASVGSVTDNLMRNVVPEYLSSLNESRVSAVRTLHLTVAGLLFSAFISVSVASVQAYLSSISGADSSEQAKQTLLALQQQLEAAKGVEERLVREFSIQRKQNEELNARLVEALREIPAPVIKIVKVPVPEVKVVK